MLLDWLKVGGKKSRHALQRWDIIQANKECSRGKSECQQEQARASNAGHITAQSNEGHKVFDWLKVSGNRSKRVLWRRAFQHRPIREPKLLTSYQRVVLNIFGRIVAESSPTISSQDRYKVTARTQNAHTAYKMHTQHFILTAYTLPRAFQEIEDSTVVEGVETYIWIKETTDVPSRPPGC
eukprot:1160466-Pelagomonas_calceolata.AAC.9